MMYCTGRTVLYLQICDLCVCVAVPTRILIPSNYHYIPYIPYIPYSMVYIYRGVSVYHIISHAATGETFDLTSASLPHKPTFEVALPLQPQRGNNEIGTNQPSQ